MPYFFSGAGVGAGTGAAAALPAQQPGVAALPAQQPALALSPHSAFALSQVLPSVAVADFVSVTFSVLAFFGDSVLILKVRYKRI
jgi:hypothetical protein